MRASKLIILPFLFQLLTACGGGNGDDAPGISGTINGAEGSMVYFQKMQGKSFKKVDSAQLGKDGSFSMKNPAGKKDLYFLGLDRTSRMVVITDSSEHLHIKVDSADLGKRVKKVEGSKDTRLLYEYYADLQPLRERMDSLQQLFRSGQRTQEVKKAMKDARKEVERMTREFVNAHPNSPAIIPALSSINAKKNVDLLKKSYKNLKKSLDHSPFLAHLGQKVKQVQAKERQQKQRKKMRKERQKLLKKGKEAPDLALKTPKGNVKPLSELEGKVVLIDFWASWCKPCIKELPKLKEVYKKYNDKGFEIYGVSLDKKKKSWTRAIEKYNMDWVHVSDLKFWNSAAAQKYKVKSIPFTVLVDRDGKIIASGLRAHELEKKLKEVMG